MHDPASHDCAPHGACCGDAACHDGCCGASPRRTVTDLFERGYRRNRLPPLAIEGDACRSADDLTARFSLAMRNGIIVDIRFRATVCATLVAYCELVAELTAGHPLDAVRAVSALSLVSALPGVPALKRDRAVLTAAAFRAALAAADAQAQTDADAVVLNDLGATDEGRLHLRHAAP